MEGFWLKEALNPEDLRFRVEESGIRHLRFSVYLQLAMQKTFMSFLTVKPLYIPLKGRSTSVRGFGCCWLGLVTTSSSSFGSAHFQCRALATFSARQPRKSRTKIPDLPRQRRFNLASWFEQRKNSRNFPKTKRASKLLQSLSMPRPSKFPELKNIP